MLTQKIATGINQASWLECCNSTSKIRAVDQAVGRNVRLPLSCRTIGCRPESMLVDNQVQIVAPNGSGVT